MKFIVPIPKISADADNNSQNETVIKVNKKSKYKNLFVVFGILSAIVILFVVLPFIFYFQSKKAVDKVYLILSNRSYQNIDSLRIDYEVIKNSVKEIQESYKLISWMRIIPFIGEYVSDLKSGLTGLAKVFEAGDIALAAVDPLLLELGYKNAEVESPEKSTEERIDFVVKSIFELLPSVDEISKKIKEAEYELSKIDPNDYPEDFRGIKLREKLKLNLEIFSKVSSYVSEGKPFLENLPYLLGIDKERKYLVLFQNDKELRPTGGFLTAYSIMKVSKAKFEPVVSDDIYNLDSRYKPVYPAPSPIVDLIKGPYVLSKNIRLRDMNYNPDFKLSMDLFSKEIKKVGIDNIDGIIAVDTGLLVNFLDSLGEIGVPGFGNFSTKIEPRCNCPQVIYELESFADVEGPIIWDPVTGKIILRPPNSDNRKKIIGPLMNSILANSMAQPKEKLPSLLNSVFKSVVEKHVLFYFFDEKMQKAVEGLGIAGRIEESFQGDYLHINDSNLGGRKSNLYVKQEVKQEIVVNRDGAIEKIVTITYKNPEKHDGWLNSVLPNWIRIYVPRGSILISADGLEKQYDTFEELNKTVFSGYFKLRPEGVSRIVFKYILPIKSRDFKMLIQKQAGTNAPLYIVRTEKQEEEFLLNMDKELRIKL